jgi:4-carboxymuconolactone decarboxylase
MRLSRPRVKPATPSSWTPDQREVLEPYERDKRLLNIFMTIGNNPKALKAFATWGGYVRRETRLEEREKELVILRMGWLCKAGYEWTQHKRLALAAGLSEVEVERIKTGAAAPGWSDKEAALLETVDELQSAYFVSDKTWNRLRSHYSEASCMDVVYITGHYSQVCMILNTFGVQVEPNATLDPDFKPSD